jgi:uncharacterized protein
MINRISKVSAIVVVSLMAVAGLVWAVTVGNQPQQALAQEVADGPAVTERTVTVSGVGRVSARPDTALIRIGVETEADTAAEAMAENSSRMQAVISATVAAGVDEDDIQTQSIQLHPIYDQQRPATTPGPPQIVGYRARNIVQVIVRDLDDLGALLDEVVEAGGTTIENIRFEVADVDEALNEAREAAMADAQQRAELLTAAAGAQVGEVLTIMEFTDRPPIPLAMPQIEREVMDVPVQPGLEVIEARVQVVWRIR